MQQDKLQGASHANLRASRRRAVSVTQEELVKMQPIQPGETLPLLAVPAADKLDLMEWARNNTEIVAQRLLQHGAILFRNFDLSTVGEFEQFIAAVSGNALEYRERSSPRSQVSGNIYTSTDHPADQTIFLHNEHSYATTIPLKIFFFCVMPAEQGGATPIGDMRKLFQIIPPKIRERFRERQYMYVRNFGDGFGLSWQTAFQTTDKNAVEQYCQRHKISYEWKDGDRLRTCQVRPAVIRHPQTGEEIWFNHLTFFHVFTLPAHIREALLTNFAEKDLPNNTYYGDGSPIEESVLAELQAAHRHVTAAFPWQRGDLLMLDNVLTSHGREPFVGTRKIVVGMSEPFTRSDF